jgi:[ribosomal protein S5]-alanine N-acetyltransferase
MQEALAHIPQVLTSPNVILRRYQTGEGAMVYRLAARNIHRLIDHFPKTVAQLTDEKRGELFVRNKIAEWNAQKGYVFGMWEASGQHYIGQISAKNIDWEIPRAELSYYIDEAYEGKGMVKEALLLIIRFCFDYLHTQKLFIRTTPTNTRSGKLAENCGFRKEGIIRNDFVKYDKTLSDVVYYGMTAEDFCASS